MRSIIVYGPQSCGKTHNAERIAKAYGLKKIVDGFTNEEGTKLDREGTLYLTNLPFRKDAIEGVRLVPYLAAMKTVGRKGIK